MLMVILATVGCRNAFGAEAGYSYEVIPLEGKTANFLNINPWTQFFDLKGRKDMPVSRCGNITVRNCRFECDTYFNVKTDEAHYHLHDITLANLEITAADISCNRSAVENLTVQDVKLTKKDGIEYPDSVTTI